MLFNLLLQLFSRLLLSNIVILIIIEGNKTNLLKRLFAWVFFIIIFNSLRILFRCLYNLLWFLCLFILFWILYLRRLFVYFVNRRLLLIWIQTLRLYLIINPLISSIFFHKDLWTILIVLEHVEYPDVNIGFINFTLTKWATPESRAWMRNNQCLKANTAKVLTIFASYRNSDSFFSVRTHKTDFVW